MYKLHLVTFIHSPWQRILSRVRQVVSIRTAGHSQHQHMPINDFSTECPTEMPYNRLLSLACPFLSCRLALQSSVVWVHAEMVFTGVWSCLCPPGAAVGCPQLSVSPHASVHLSTPGYAIVGTMAFVRCNSTNMSWNLTCGANNTWLPAASAASMSTATASSGQHRHQQLFDDCPSMNAASASAGTPRGRMGPNAEPREG
jgi:hypothetical protein